MVELALPHIEDHFHPQIQMVVKVHCSPIVYG